MTDRKNELRMVVDQVRVCFNLLKTLAEAMHDDLAVTPSMRAVMEALALAGAQTVPDIARARGVSRQHIQIIMNTLQERDLAVSHDNPAHKRSPLYELTPSGRTTFELMRKREAEPLGRLASSMASTDLTSAATALTDLNRILRDELERREPSDLG
ncbi:helix-turn-helix domain-containing protein [Thalassobaculum sp.]|uniref:MarR family winged helix-turn-helix transcriptional regulator n=1 Tax=Thalassobaculum sp. TaxID=2022740 RepID=UPI0032EBD245